MDTNIKLFLIRPYRSILILVFLVISCKAQPPEENSVSLEPPADSTLFRYGRLPNGFTYYIKSLSEPHPKLYMNFIHKPGSNELENYQINLPHAVEHLAFKTTENFPEGVDNIKEIKEGIMVNYDIKAYSGKRRTQYFFDVPKDNVEALKTGFTFFRDIADGLLLTAGDIEAVKKELRQEYLMKVEDLEKSAAESLLQHKIFPCAKDYSDFLNKQNNMQPEEIRKFYHNYYRPDLLAISIVGNINDIGEMEKKIKSTFSDLKGPEQTIKLRNCDSIYFEQPSQFHVVEVKREADSSSIFSGQSVNLQLFFRDPETMQALDNLAGIKRLLLIDLLNKILESRFSEISKAHGFAPVVTNNLFTQNMPAAFRIRTNLENLSVKTALQKIVEILMQLEVYGVTRKEWNDVKNSLNEVVNSQSEANPKYWKDQISAHFIYKQLLLENKIEIQGEMLSDLTLNEFNDFITAYFSQGPQDIGIIAPTGHEALSLKEEEVRHWIKEQQKKPIQPFAYSKVPESLLRPEQVNNLNEIIRYKEKEKAPGITEYTLRNGLKLVLQRVEPASEKDEKKILIHGFSNMGICNVPEEKYFSALYAPQIVTNSGVNNLNKFEVEQYLEKKGILPGGLNFYVDYNETGIQVFAEADQLETFLQLIYLYFTNPNKSNTAYEEWKQKKHRQSSNVVIGQFHQEVKNITGDVTVLENFFGRKAIPGGAKFLEGIESIDLDTSFRFFNDYFGSPQDFTFIVSGDINNDSVLPILSKYLGNIPKGVSKEKPCPVLIQSELPKESKLYNIPALLNADLKDVKYGWKYIKEGASLNDWQEQLKFEMLGELTNLRARDLRLKQGFAIYNIQAYGELNKNLSRYELTSYLDLVPEEYTLVREEVHRMIKELKNSLVPQDLLQKALQRMLKRYNLIGTNKIIQERHEMLVNHYRFGQPLIDRVEMKSFLESITIYDIREIADELFHEKNLLEFVMKEKEL